MKSVFSMRLQAARGIRNITLSGLRQITGIDAAQIANFEAGRRKPSMDNLKKLSVGLDVSADYLLGTTDFPFVTQQTVVNNLLSVLSNRDFDLIMNLLHFFNRQNMGCEEEYQHEKTL
jgi:transcriptional regulator with XRE-family HTH domain